MLTGELWALDRGEWMRGEEGMDVILE